MSNPHDINSQNPAHSWQKEERKLDDGFTYYYLICTKCHDVRFPGPQLQALQNYSKTNLFFFIEDWVLLLLYAGHRYIAGNTHYQKMLFLIFYEYVEHYHIPSENPGFFGYKYGPFSARVDNAIGFYIENGYIRSEGRKSTTKERFYITTKGKEKGRVLYNKLSVVQRKPLKEFRKFWDQKTAKAICKYVYSKDEYKKFTNESLILNDLFPGVKLYRRRG